MTITYELTLDMQHKGELQRVEVVQGDALTRQVDLVLQYGGAPWTIPVCEPVVRYLKPDGTAGVYDTLPDGGAAIMYAGNVLTLVLAPQMLTCSGAVQVQVELNAQELKLATFTFLVVVEPGVALGGESEDYVNWTKAFLPQIKDAEEGQLLRITRADGNGRAVELEGVQDPTTDLFQQLDGLEDRMEEIFRYAEDAAFDALRAAALAEAALPGPQSAEVGQYLRVSEVDEQGKVTALVATNVQVTDGGGGNIHFMSQDFTLPEDVTGFDIQLPVPIKNLIMYNMIVVRPDYQPSVATGPIYAVHGNYSSNVNFAAASYTGSTNITGFRYGNFLAVTCTERSQDSYYEATKPVIGAGGKAVGQARLNDSSTISLICITDGIVFPAGTQVKFWGVYFSEDL